MDTKEQIFSLMAAAEQQQQAVEGAIQSLENERLALAKERAALSQAAASLTATAAAALPAIQKAAGDAVGVSVRQSMAGFSGTAAKSLGEASEPFFARLTGVIKAASDAESSIKRAGQWFAWKWVALAAGGLAGVCLVGFVLVGWQIHQVDTLKAEIVQLTANADEWKKRAGKAELSTCGEQKRTCVRVDKSAGNFGTDNKQYMVVNGY